MNTTQLLCALNCDSHLKHWNFRICSIDTLPSTIKTPFTLIVNSDFAAGRGKHWFAILIQSNDVGEFFDSYGNHPSYYGIHIWNFFKKYCKYLIYNNVKLQSNDSYVCGEYCLLYIMMRVRECSMYDFQKMFTNECFINDLFVYDYVRSMFPYCIQ